MSPQVSAIMLGVKDLAHAKRFYAEGLGFTIDPDGYLWKVTTSAS